MRMTTSDEITAVTEIKPNVMEPASGKDSPGVIVFPPLLYVGTLLLGLLLQYFLPWPLASGRLVRMVGGIVALASGLFALWGARTMRRAKTNILPDKPTLAIVSDGPFRFTRNPLYLGNAIFYVGLTLIFNTVWPLLLLVPMLAVVHWGIIRREERYLEAKFGETYLTYKARVRRWL
jgi:protein-S-isoprenylcysteine O-methyltransferase Ste14